MTVFQIIKKILKYAVYSFIAFIFLFFFWRIYTSGHDPKNLKRVEWNDALAQVYEDDAEQFRIYTQGDGNVMSDDGYFMTNYMHYIPDAKQLQVTLKYNRSTLRFLAQNLKLVPFGEEPFVFYLVDDDGKTLSSDYTFFEDSYALYRYYRITFYGVDISDAETVKLQVCLNHDVFKEIHGKIYTSSVLTYIENNKKE